MMMMMTRKKRVFIGVVGPALISLMFSILSALAALGPPIEGAEESALDRPPRLTPCPVSIAGVDTLQVRLDGTWRFNPAPPEEFWKTEPSVGVGWTPIEVPGEWAMQGFTVAENTAAGYWRLFVLPSEWEGQRVKLRCDAVYSDATVWVNGQLAGRHVRRSADPCWGHSRHTAMHYRPRKSGWMRTW